MNVFRELWKRAENLAEGLLNDADEFVYNRQTFADERNVHGFYKLKRPDGSLLEYRHHCDVSGDFAVSPPTKGSVVAHCIDRRQSVFDPDAPMPTVVRFPRPAPGSARLADGSLAFPANWDDSDPVEWCGDGGPKKGSGNL
jgi:hypothetical protein